MTEVTNKGRAGFQICSVSNSGETESFNVRSISRLGVGSKRSEGICDHGNAATAFPTVVNLVIQAYFGICT